MIFNQKKEKFKMNYLENVHKGDEVFGLVFGLGKVRKVLKDSKYKCIVEFENNNEIAYTVKGIPQWGNFQNQTLFYKKDIDLTELDFSPLDKVLTPKKIIKLREKQKLEVQLPSGIWHPCNQNVKRYTEELLENEQYHLFRKLIHP